MRYRPRLLAVALACTVACAPALAGCGDRAADDAPGGTGEQAGSTGPASGSASDSDASSPGAATAIPDDFPLSAGMGGPEDTIPTSRTGTGLRGLTLCGTAPLRGVDTRDRMVADNSGGESADTRELVLLGSREDAVALARSFEDLVNGCDGPDVSGGMETTTEVRRSPFGPAPATMLVQTYTFDGRPGQGHTIVHVVPVGAAVLVASTFGQSPTERLEQDAERTVSRLRESVGALALFGEAPTPSSQTSATAGSSAAVTPIPADFPLDAGMVADGSDFVASPPSADGDGMGEVEMCGRVVWPLGDTAGGTRRLVTGVLGPEYHEARELLVHADADAAVEAMGAVRRAAEECRSFDNQVWTVLHRDTGYDTVTMGLTYDDGLGSAVFQVTRVGSARLMVQTYGEGSLASLDEQADGVTETTEKIVPAMCVFTNTGC